MSGIDHSAGIGPLGKGLCLARGCKLTLLRQPGALSGLEVVFGALMLPFGVSEVVHHVGRDRPAAG